MKEPIKLTELEPRWWSTQSGRHGQGINFLCPRCREEYIGVAFKNPVDGGSPAPNCKYYWIRIGDSFESLTLQPSIDATIYGHWHGEVRGGNMFGVHGLCQVYLEVQDGKIKELYGS